MAQSIILKRSSLPGKVPDTGSLNTGELAINTYDGKIFIKRSGNLDSIQSVLTTDSITTGSITLTQTASIGELIVTQDANVQRDLFVIRDIITNRDIDAGGDISGSGLQVNDTLNIVHGQFNLSASTSITGAVGIDGDLTILGAVNARQFNINVISSSVIYQSGSTKFGDTIDDTHEFTGSIDVTGSIVLNGVELGGSTNSGSFTGSFTGSFIGDGSGLRGVVSDELPKNGYDYNIDDVATINDFNATSSKYLIDFDIDAMIGTPVGHKTYIANFTGSTKVIPAGDSVRFHVHDVEVARIDENGFSGSINFPAGVVSGSSQLTSSYDTRYVLSGSITQTTWDNIASKPSGIISGSSQLTSSYDTRYALSGSVGGSSISSSMMETIKYVGDGSTTSFVIPNGYYTKMINVYLNGSKLEESEYTETNSTTISITPAILSGSILEIVNFRAATLNQGLTRKVELYTATSNQTTFNTIASASLGNVDIHINGFKLPPTDFTIVNTNTITLATGSNAGELVEIGIYDGYFGTYLGYESLSSLNQFTASLSTSSLATTGSNTFRGTQTMSGSILPALDNTYDLGSPTYQWRDIYVSSGSLYIDGTKVLSSTNQELQITTDEGQSIKILEQGSDNIILQTADGDVELKSSGGGDILLDPTAGLISVKGTLQIQDGQKITSSGGNNVVFGNNITITGSIETTGNVNGVNLTAFSSSVATEMSTIQTKTGSFATTGSNTFFGTQTYSGSVYIANDLIVQGSSSIQYISASSVSIGTNIVQLNTANPSVRYAGLTITDSGSVGGSGSFLYDSVQDEFIFVHRGNGINVTSSHFVLGPETYDSLGDETYLTVNKLPKGTGKEHLNDSNITDTGTLITLGSNTTITGTLLATGTTLLSGSSQVDVMSTTNIARLATTGSNIFIGNQTITGSFFVSGSNTSSTPLISFRASGSGTFQRGVQLLNPGMGVGDSIMYSVGRQDNSMNMGQFYFVYAGDGSTNNRLSLGLHSADHVVNILGTSEVLIGTTTTNSAGKLQVAGNIVPEANGTRDLGSASYRWSTVYTSDLSLNNGIGDWTIVEGEDDLFLYNNKKGKVYKFALTEVDPNVATPKKS